MESPLPRQRCAPTALRIVTPTHHFPLKDDSSPLSDSKPSSLRNSKKLSLNLLDMSLHSRPRRPSVLSLPNTALHRKDEDGSPTVPYSDGPVQVLPRVWLGSEDNARDWPALTDRGITSILNVAKEVVSPFDLSPLRPFPSTPNLPATSTHSYYPPHFPSGRPPMHYLKLQWSHGQRDLVTHGFPTAMSFVDAALERNEGVLIHCQCGISRSATLMIAIVMRAAATRSPWVPPHVWDLKGMQAAYSFVKEKSKHAGPNMSLIYQLLDYEKALQGDSPSPASSDKSYSSEDEKEWGRRRNAFADHDDEARDIDPVQQEAKDLDKAMEERVIARMPSASSLTSGVGMGPAWKNRYSRKRTGSTASVHTTGSVLSEDLVEADEEAELLGLGGFDDITEPRRSPSLSSESPGSPSESNTQFTLLSIPSAAPLPPVRRHLSSAPSAPPTKLSFNMPRLSSANMSLKIIPGKPKRRPPPLGILPPVPPSPMTPIPVQDGRTSPRRRRHMPRKQAPSPLKVRGETSRIVFPSKTTAARLPMTATPSQTLFVFPPSPTVAAATALRTPSTMTVTSNVHNESYPFPVQSTPRVATSRSQGRTKSFIGVGTSVAPTIAYSRVDARGWVGVE